MRSPTNHHAILQSSPREPHSPWRLNWACFPKADEMYSSTSRQTRFVLFAMLASILLGIRCVFILLSTEIFGRFIFYAEKFPGASRISSPISDTRHYRRLVPPVIFVLLALPPHRPHHDLSQSASSGSASSSPSRRKPVIRQFTPGSP